MIKKIFKDESGQGMVEYGLILALVAIVITASLTTLGTNIKGIFDKINTTMSGILTAGSGS